VKDKVPPELNLHVPVTVADTATLAVSAAIAPLAAARSPIAANTTKNLFMVASFFILSINNLFVPG